MVTTGKKGFAHIQCQGRGGGGVAGEGNRGRRGGKGKTHTLALAEGQWAVLTLLTVGHTQRVPQNGIQMFNANFNVNVNECVCVCEC